MGQDVMSPELTEKVRRYELDCQNWRKMKSTISSGAIVSCVLAVLAWVFAFVAAGAEGHVHQNALLYWVMVFCFIVAMLLTLAAVALTVGYSVCDKPNRDFVLPEKEFTDARD